MRTSQLVAQIHQKDALRSTSNYTLHSGLPATGLPGPPVLIHQLQPSSKGARDQSASSVSCYTRSMHHSPSFVGQETWMVCRSTSSSMAETNDKMVTSAHLYLAIIQFLHRHPCMTSTALSVWSGSMCQSDSGNDEVCDSLESITELTTNAHLYLTPLCDTGRQVGNA